MKKSITILLSLITYLSYGQIDLKAQGWIVEKRKIDTVKVKMLITNQDSSTPMAFAASIWGYSVRELHNTSEGQMDPGMSPGLYHDYWQHLYYLDKDKLPLPKSIVVWLSKEN